MKKIISTSLLYFLFSCTSNTNNTFQIDYEKFELDNGLDVILHEDKSDPIVSVTIMWHVGSNRELPGKTGFAHLFEHFLYESSQHVEKGEFEKTIYDAGGFYNATINKDRTMYFQVVPKNALERLLWMDADGMGWFLPTVSNRAFEREQAAVQNEKRLRVDNRPYGHQNYAMIKNMYPNDHPYSWTVIGELEDLQSSTLEDARDFYNKWYGPNNATISISGDIDKKEVKKLVEKYFTEIKKGTAVINPEPWLVTLDETKKVYHEDNFARSPRLQMTFPTVDQRNPDKHALILLAQLLSDGRKSVLYNKIVEEGKLAPNISASNSSIEIAGTFNITSTGFQETNLTDIENKIKEAFIEFENKAVLDSDLDRIKAKYETGFYNSISSALNKGVQLAWYNEFFGSPGSIKEDLNSILNVNTNDISRVYEKYIKGKNYVLTSFVPKGRVDLIAEGSLIFPIKEEKIEEENFNEFTEGGLGIPDIPSILNRSVKPAVLEHPQVTIPKVWSHAYNQNGLNLYGTEQNELPLIRAEITIHGGMLLDNPENVGVSNLMTDILMEGTKNKTPQELEDAIDGLGSSISMYTDKESIKISVFSLKRNFQPTLDILEEILFEPRWDENELEKIIKKTVEQIKRQNSDPTSIADNVYQKLIYKSHIFSNSTLGSADYVKSITMQDLKNYYSKNISSHLTNITIVGDIKKSNAINAFKPIVSRWKKLDVEIPQYDFPEEDKKGAIYFVDIPNAKQSIIRAGFLGPSRSNKEYFPATAMNSRLGYTPKCLFESVLRGEKGYTYAARSFFTGTRYPGPYTVWTSVKTNSTEDSMNSIYKLLSNYRNPISQDDLDFSMNIRIKSNARRFETLGSLQGMLSNIANYKLPFDYIKEEEGILKGMTVESHNKLAKQYINPDQMIYLIVGDAKSQLNKLNNLVFGKPILLDREGNQKN